MTSGAHGGGPVGPPLRVPDPDAWAPLDAAVRAYLEGRADARVSVVTDVAGAEDFPVALLFREPAAFDAVDRTALEACRGRVLDIGAGVGALAGPLAEAGRSVTALEVLPAAVQALRARGVTDVRRGGVEVLAPQEGFDTALALMNGTGLVGSLDELAAWLDRVARALRPGGALLLDSTDPRGWGDPDDGRYPGEVHMRLSFDGVEGAPFPYLYADPDAVLDAARRAGLSGSIVLDAGEGRFLARLERPAL